jgi:mono/diheme cytochrome c family protein
MNLHRAIGIAAFLGLTACSSGGGNGARSPASIYNEDATKPSGLGRDEAAFNHLAEGSEIYPYDWMMALPSENGPFIQGLDKRHNFLRDDRAAPYLMPWVGMTATWSDHDPQGADAMRSDATTRTNLFNGKKSIKMVGVNCAACHTSQMTYQGKTFRLDGAPNLVNIRAFFKDLGKSTISLFIKPDLMIAFLKAQNVAEPEKRAAELDAYFYRRFGGDTGYFGHGKVRQDMKKVFYLMVGRLIDEGKIGTLATLFRAKHNNTARLFKGKKAIADSLEMLLRVTYGFGPNEDIGVLKNRMQFLGVLFSGNDPKMAETIAGYGRTDAFGRISNLVLRGDHPVDNTAPVSFPWIWALQYKEYLHYNGNTNSVVMRNVGQSLGLGSVITNSETGESTSNMHNLDRLEKLTYKIRVPEWNRVFAGTNLEVKDRRASLAYGQGKAVYERECASCHTGSPMSSGSTGASSVMIDYKMFPLDLVGTDRNDAILINTPVNGEPFHESIFNATRKVKEAYYEKNGVSAEQQAIWEGRAIRGPEFFRDTYLETKMGYRALHLAGVWATAPFLHNGSVPTIADLLKTAKDRPKFFHVGNREVDPVRLGYAAPILDEKCDEKDESCFDTTLAGNHNSGHEYGTDLDEESKQALIEYLKVLPPEPEYAW